MYDNIFKEIQKKAYFAKHQNILLAVSGGVDSMNLLHFLYHYRDRLSVNIGIAHINHKQRQQSEIEEAYLREWAAKHQIPIYIGYFSGVFSEKAARDFRYQFFEKIMLEKHYTAVVTAHHADDQAETIFMRFLRGSRLRHLSGMSVVRQFGSGELIRPFLTISKNQLPDIFHFEDDSNQSLDYLRNRIRNQYFPILEKENANFKQAIQGIGYETKQLYQAIRDLTESIDITDCSQFLKQTKAVQMILFQNYLENFPDLQISHAQFDEILRLLQNKTNMVYQIKNGYWLQKDYHHFQITKIRPQTDGKTSGKWIQYGDMVTYGQYQFQITDKMGDGIPIYSSLPIYLRRRKTGDSIDFGNFSKKLRRLFIDEKISVQERLDAIVGEQNHQIIFVLVANKTYLRKSPKHGTMENRLYIEKIRDR